MLKNLTYRKKNILLLVCSVLFSLIIYFFSVAQTIKLITLCNRLEQQLHLADDAPQKLSELKFQLGHITSRLGQAGKFGGDVQQALLEMISGFCNENNLVLKEFPQPVITIEQNFVVETNTVVVEGEFIKLLKLVYQLEQVQRIGKVSSVHFQAKEDVKTKRLVLTASLYLQNIKIS